MAPELAWVEAWGSALHAGGVLAIHAGTLDTTIHIRDEDRVTVSVTTASGDAESVDLEREICEATLCSGFSIMMEPGISAATLYPLMAQFPYGGFGEGDFVSHRFPARITGLRAFDERFATGYVWRKGDMPRFISRLQEVTGVNTVTRTGIGCGNTCPPWHSFVAVTGRWMIARRNPTTVGSKRTSATRSPSPTRNQRAPCLRTGW